MAASILRLAEQGRLALYDPLAQHLIDEKCTLITADGYDLDVIALRHVLSHPSGLDELAGDDSFEATILADPRHQWTREEQVRRCVE